MDLLIRDSRELTQLNRPSYRRPLFDLIDWEWRLIGIRGARGVGKTTLMLQHMVASDPGLSTSVYLSLDDLYFTHHSLRDTVRTMRALGYRRFYLDEVHKYPNWARELKNVYDLHPDLWVVFTGSSVLQLLRQDVDLSRRVISYDMYGLSFREHLRLRDNIVLAPVAISDIFDRHREISDEIIRRAEPLTALREYYDTGYYPYYYERPQAFHGRLRETVNLVLRTDLTVAEGGQVRQVRKLSRLLQLIAESVPFKPNLSSLATRTELDRHTLARYLDHLANAQITANLPAAGSELGSMQKPEKIYLYDPNLAYALSTRAPAIGMIRETFFQNQVSTVSRLTIPKKGDFVLENGYTVEIGGPNKNKRQIAGIERSALVLDGIQRGGKGEIPLYLFGLLY